jgi:hypothetical protein
MTARGLVVPGGYCFWLWLSVISPGGQATLAAAGVGVLSA